MGRWPVACVSASRLASEGLRLSLALFHVKQFPFDEFYTANQHVTGHVLRAIFVQTVPRASPKWWNFHAFRRQIR
jgi:hypothetical protein